MGTPRRSRFVDIVLQVALAELARAGYDGLTIPAVAARAGVHKTSIYRRWPDKAALVGAALERSMDGARPATPSRAGTLRNELVEMAVRTAAVARSPAGRAALRMLLGESEKEGVRTLVGGMLRAGAGPRRRLALAVENGELRRGTDPALILTLLAGAILQRALVERRPVPRSFIVKCVDAVLTGTAVALPRKRS